eukprot:gene6844-4286_t
MAALPAVVVLTALAAPRLLLRDAVVYNGTERLLWLTSQASAGTLRPGAPPYLPLGDAGPNVSQCGLLEESTLIIGWPPSECRSGPRHVGRVHRGFAVLTLPPDDTMGATTLRYPGPAAPATVNVTTIGAFKNCWTYPDTEFEGLTCPWSTSLAYYLAGNQSVVWVLPTQYPVIQTAYLFVTTIVVALVATPSVAEFRANRQWLSLVGADAAVGGGMYYLFTLGQRGPSAQVELELDKTLSQLLSLISTSYAMACGFAVWAHITTKVYPGLLRSTPYPAAAESLAAQLAALAPAVRDLIELPLLISIGALWPPTVGAPVARTLSLATGMAVAVVSGRAAQNRAGKWARAAVMGAGVLSSTTAMIAGVASTGCVPRGTPVIILTGTLAAHGVLAGWAVQAI